MLGHSQSHRLLAEAGRLPSPVSEPAGAKERLQWKLNRLRCMTPAEIAHRIVRTFSMHAEELGLLRPEEAPPPDLSLGPRFWVRAPAMVDAAGYLAAAGRI